MKRVTIIGCFAENYKLFDGQTIKTMTIKDELEQYYGKNEVMIVDTYNWKKNILELLIKCIKSFQLSENIIMLPAKNGLTVFAPLLSLLNKFFNRKIHYIVIGGWLYEYLNNKKYLVRYLKNFKGIYVETKKMKENLENLDLKNTYVMPNFKRLQKATLSSKTNYHKDTFKFCTFSRVMREKGISTAINLVSNLNKKGIQCYLDIYGKVVTKKGR